MIKKNSWLSCFSFLCLAFCASEVTAKKFEVKGVLQSQTAIVSDEEPSFINQGTGLLRHDDDDKHLISQAFVSVSGQLANSLALHAVANVTEDPDERAGLTQFFLQYKPILAQKYRWQFRAGMFYPEMGFENPDIGWISPFAYTNSAISSWIGEELRTIGGEFKVTRPGRLHGFSPHTFAFTGSVYKGNDPTGTILAWRGWALHDKQTLTNERLYFADYPSIGPGAELEPQANFVEPYREIDGRWGYRFGLHWDYQKKSRVRYYYYNNNADDSILARNGQYAWHTIFHSLAWQYRFNREWRLISQAMHGNTSMGAGAVKVDFTSWYVMLNYRDKKHGVTARFDNFKTIDTDNNLSLSEFIPVDDNNGDGWSITATYRYTFNDHWQVGTELVYVDSFQANRAQLGVDTDISQTQILGVAQYRF